MLGEKKSSKIKVQFEEKPHDGLSVLAYGFDARGNLTAKVPVGADGTVDTRKLEGATRAFLAPAPSKEVTGRDEPTLSSLQRMRAFELPLSQESVFVSKDIIRYWIWCVCAIQGRVVRPVSYGPTTTDMPVCKARVHICEVDPWYFLIEKVPFELLVRARDEILGNITEIVQPPARIPPRPIPDPAPIERRLQVETQSRVVTAPLATRAATASPRLDMVQAKSSLALQDVVKQLPSHVTLALSTNSELHLRQAFVAQKQYIYPLLCWWWWWFLDCDEIAVVDTVDDGRFWYPYWYLCGGDKPDLYFWVEYQIGGVWETVYDPPVACNTWWNYPCGTDVTIRVTDPRVPYCEPDPLFPGSVVVVTTLGGGINMSRIDQTTGLIDGAPFGGDLEPHVDFGAALRNSAQQFYYRWSWRTAGTSDTYRPIQSPIFRRYLIEYNDAGHTTAYGVERLGPVDIPAGSLFQIPRVDAPAVAGATTTRTVLYPRPDTASAIFHTQDDIGFTNRSVELLLELFDHDGNLVDWTAAGIADKVLDPTLIVPPTTGTIATVDATAYRVLNGVGGVVGLRFRMQVDNNRCTASLLPLEATGLVVDANCGFYKYTDVSQQVTVKYVASHPNNFATFSFGINRGPGNPVTAASASGRVGADAPPYTLVAGDYSASFHLVDLLGPTCPAAAFSEEVDVSSMATDGWGGPGNLNASDHGAFALAPQ